MKQSSPQTGPNRTGMQTAPLDGSRMQDAWMTHVASVTRVTLSAADDDALLALGLPANDIRARYAADADALGSVPQPATLSGASATGMAALSGRPVSVLIDKLGERLAFERCSVRLYDALLVKLSQALEFDAGMGVDTTAAPGTQCSISIDAARAIREQERAHLHTVIAAIDSIGADPTAVTPCADLAGVETSGLIKVLTDPRTSLDQSLHALLTAEMADNAGWEMLIALAEPRLPSAMVDDFRLALAQETAHLEQVRTWLTELTLGGDRAQRERGSGHSRMRAPQPPPVH